MENKDKIVENGKTLRKSDNINRVLLKDLIFYVEEFINRKDDITTHLADVIKKIFYSHLTVLDKNVSNELFDLHQKSIDTEISK